MSCVHYQATDPSRERCCYDTQYNRYVSPSYTPRIRTPEAYRSGYYAGWRPLEFQYNNVEYPTAARGDPPFPDPRMQPGRMTPCKQEAIKHADALVFEKMQTRMKLLEDSNTATQSRNQNLIAENKALSSRLEVEQSEVKRLENKMVSLREELNDEKSKLAEMTKAAEERKIVPTMRDSGTSTTNVLSRFDRGVQVWAVCVGCQKKLDGCEKNPPTVTITKSELEELEKDMRTLRDTIIAREEAWDKAVEREQNYRQQLLRLTTETITARHISETRHEELENASKTLTVNKFRNLQSSVDVNTKPTSTSCTPIYEKESELKSLQKDNLYLTKLIAKLYNNYQSRRGQEECRRSNLAADINEKEQKFIEEVVQRVSAGKSKQKPKSKSAYSDRTPNLGTYQASPRDKSSKTTKEQTGSFREPKR